MDNIWEKVKLHQGETFHMMVQLHHYEGQKVFGVLSK